MGNHRSRCFHGDRGKWNRGMKAHGERCSETVIVSHRTFAKTRESRARTFSRKHRSGDCKSPEAFSKRLLYLLIVARWTVNCRHYFIAIELKGGSRLVNETMQLRIVRRHADGVWPSADRNSKSKFVQGLPFNSSHSSALYFPVYKLCCMIVTNFTCKWHSFEVEGELN